MFRREEGMRWTSTFYYAICSNLRQVLFLLLGVSPQSEIMLCFIQQCFIQTDNPTNTTLKTNNLRILIKVCLINY